MLLFEKLEAQGLRLVLASQSPRRRALMEGSHLKCEVVCYAADESYPDELPAEQVAEYIARKKSDHYPIDLPECDILITADTIVLHDGKILGKPRDKEQAREMLRTIAGTQHEVITGVVIRSSKKSVSFSCSSLVKFAHLTQEEIDFYVEQYKPLDKAGSYGIQEWIGYIGIEGIEGSFYNVMGLPIQRLYTELNKFIS